jgi:gamma-glutamyltranspeptidase
MNGGMANFARAAPLRRGTRLFGVSNMTPAIAASANGDRVAVGCPGARRIPANVALAMARRLLAGESLQGAVSGGRFHAESGDLVSFEEDRLGPAVRHALEARFARVVAEDSENYFGPLTALGVTAAGEVEAAVDDRLWQGFHAPGRARRA